MATGSFGIEAAPPIGGRDVGAGFIGDDDPERLLKFDPFSVSGIGLSGENGETSSIDAAGGPGVEGFDGRGWIPPGAVGRENLSNRLFFFFFFDDLGSLPRDPLGSGGLKGVDER